MTPLDRISTSSTHHRRTFGARRWCDEVEASFRLLNERVHRKCIQSLREKLIPRFPSQCVAVEVFAQATADVVDSWLVLFFVMLRLVVWFCGYAHCWIQKRQRRIIGTVSAIDVDGRIHNNRPFVAARTPALGSRELHLLVDSGSGCNLLDRSIYKEMKRRDDAVTLEDIDVDVMTHTGERIPCVGVLKVDLDFVGSRSGDQRLESVPFIVIDSPGSIPVIGGPLLRDSQSSLTYLPNGGVNVKFQNQLSEIR